MASMCQLPRLSHRLVGDIRCRSTFRVTDVHIFGCQHVYFAPPYSSQPPSCSNPSSSAHNPVNMAGCLRHAPDIDWSFRCFLSISYDGCCVDHNKKSKILETLLLCFGTAIVCSSLVSVRQAVVATSASHHPYRIERIAANVSL